MTINRELLHLLESDSRLTAQQIAVMLDKEEGEIRDLIREYEKKGNCSDAAASVFDYKCPEL